MAKKCYYATAIDCYGGYHEGFSCSELLEISPGGGFCGGGAFVSRDLGLNQDNASIQSGTLVEVGLSNCVDCNGIRPEEPYDCVNGACLPARTYSTPGRYPNIAACQAACIRDSNCTGQCISTAELATLQQGANELQAKFCR
jgi:hypothetical protein